MAPIKKKHGANLPHWTAAGATYFVTFRLADSLPQVVLDAYRQEREQLLATFKEKSSFLSKEDLARLHEIFEEKIERYLDAGAGACWMSEPAVADIVQNALRFFHEQRYFIHRWAVMPNHVHAVLRPFENVQLSEITHSWKSFTAKEINKCVGRDGTLWQAESWDHLARDEEDFWRCAMYTTANPGKAGIEGVEMGGE